MFTGLITSKMRVRILMRLFLNPEQQVYLRELTNEMQVSPSQVKEELKNLSESGLLNSLKRGRQIHYYANQDHPLFPELRSMVNKALGMDHIIESILERLGDLDEAYLIGDYAEGKDTGLIDLVLIGEIDKVNLDDLVQKTERYIKRKIRTLVLSQSEYNKMSNIISGKSKLLLWKSEKTKNH